MMNSTYKISIIMGIYNCEKTLDEAIESILNQTYKDWKLIMCDDGSIDKTYQLAERYAKKYKNIMLIKNESNRGLNYTLNHCLEYVDTKYVARMDADDISLPTRLEEEIKFLEKNNEYAFVSCSMIYFDENGEWGRGTSKREPIKEDFIHGSPFCHAPCMVRTEAYKRVKGYSENKWLLRVEDYHLWYKMYLFGYKGYNIEAPLYKMRDDKDAISRRKFKYRLNETYVKWLIFKNFEISYVKIIYVIKPLLIGLLPKFLYKKLHQKMHNVKV